MSKSLTFSFGSGKQDIFSNCFSVISFDNVTGNQAIKGFKKGTNVQHLLKTYILTFNTDGYDCLEIIFKSQRVAKFFAEENDIPSNFKVKSLEGMQLLKLENSKFDENAIHAILRESLGTRHLDIDSLTKTDSEILEDLVSDINDSLTQSLLVGITKQPKIHNMSNCFGTISDAAKQYQKYIQQHQTKRRYS
jgi:hypothetical protein